MSRIDSGSFEETTSAEDPSIYYKNRFKPYMEDATRRLVEEGISPDKIACRYIQCKGDAIRQIIETAGAGNFSTVVVGRREVISFIQEHFRGRFSDKIVKATDNMAVWVVS